MKSVHIFRFLIYGISFMTFLLNMIEPIYIYFFNKPIFVHLYFVKKRLPKNKKAFLVDNITFYKRLNKKHKSYFEHRLSKFIRTYDFIARDGFQMSPEVKVLIASSYIKLTFGMRRYLTETFDKIIVYPSTYYSQMTEHYHKGEYNPGLKLIIFSWEDFLEGEIITNDNINLGIHEFTHALTFHGSKVSDASARIFYGVFRELAEFLKEEKNVEALKASNYFREYGFTNTLEFVSVVMECFFESPVELYNEFPNLHNKIETMLNYRFITNSLIDQT